MQFIGVPEDEAAFARNKGGDELLRLLIQRDAAPVTNPNGTAFYPA